MANRDTAELLTAAVRWRWPLVLIVALPFVVGAVAYTESLPSQYESSAVVAFSSASENVGADELLITLPKYPVFLSSPQTLARVAAAVDVESVELESGVRITTPPSTANVQIAVTLTDPDTAAAAANALANEAQTMALSDAELTATVVAEAVPAVAPFGPPRRLIELSATVVALLAGLALAVVIERLRPRCWTTSDMQAHVRGPLIGRLPAHSTMRRPPLQAISDQGIATHVRRARTDLARRFAGSGAGVILTVTGPVRGQGASMSAAVLALSFAAVGRRTLLVDADLRAPTAADRFGLFRRGSHHAHLGQSLRQNVSLETVAQEVAPQLFVVPSVPDAEAGDLLATRMRALLDEARETFDLVLLDADPLLDGESAGILSTLSDGVILVISRGVLQSDVVDAAEVLERLQVPITGLIANRISTSRSSAASPRPRSRSSSGSDGDRSLPLLSRPTGESSRTGSTAGASESVVHGRAVNGVESNGQKRAFVQEGPLK